jgi:glycosyltransferase involved in cell wall biosynthesis
MKVCIVSTHYPSDDAIGEYCGHMAAELSKKAEVVVIANTQPKVPKTSHIKANGGTNTYEVYRVWKKGWLYPLRIFRSIVSLKPDIIHIQHEYFLYAKGFDAILFPFILFLSKLTRKPLVTTMHHVISRDDAPYFKKLLKTSFPEIAIKMFLTGFNRVFQINSKIIVPSLNFKEVLMSDYKLNNPQIEIVKHFTNIKADKKLVKDVIEAKRLLGFEGKKVLLFYGFIRPSKGIEYLLFALYQIKKLVPNVLLIIDGKAQPNYTNYLFFLEKIVKDLQLYDNVKFQDIAKERTPLVFIAADLVIFPYVSTTGMTPIAHLTAAAYGKPIIATNLDSFNEDLVDQENALLVPPKDVNALRDSIVRLLTDDVLSQRLSNNIAAYSSKRSVENAIDDIFRIYENSCNDR